MSDNDQLKSLKVRLFSYSQDGHRHNYDYVITKILSDRGIEVVPYRDISNSNADVFFFPMVDGRWLQYIAISTLAFLSGKRAVALLFRPGECFRGSKIRRYTKRSLLSAMRLFPASSILTILPFSVDRRFNLIANNWIHDIQLWDLGFFKQPDRESRTDIRDSLIKTANGRKIVVALGGQERNKGFPNFVDIWTENDQIRDRFLFVAAGRVQNDCSDSESQLVESGGVSINRWVSDLEILELYEAADYIWCCYDPLYDQASGIFGRAFQYAKPAIVRSKSYVAALGQMLAHPILEIAVDKPKEAGKSLMDWLPNFVDPSELQVKIDRIKTRDIAALTCALTGKAPLPREVL